jgi:hypothetical protein
MCPLCSSSDVHPFATVQGREYIRCPRCLLTFMHHEHHLPPDQELAHYRCHRNDPSDAAYRKWLSQLTEPFVPLLAPGAQGLDYGSGPGPTLSIMLQEQGFDMNVYDPFFAPDESYASGLIPARRFGACSVARSGDRWHNPAQPYTEVCHDRHAS